MKHITREQRCTIFVLLEQGKSQTEIASYIGKDKSVVCRELKRNCDQRSGKYRPDLAHQKYQTRAKNKNKHIRFTQEMKVYIEQGIRDDFSPEQIVGNAKKEGKICVSHERIYQYIWEDKRKGGKLYNHLRTKGKRYRKRGNKKDRRGCIPNRVDIDDRPSIVDEKVRFGDFEIDTVIGKNHQEALVTINERKTGVVLIKKVDRKTAELVAKAAVDKLQPWKKLLHTITADNGKEFALHEIISKELEIEFYFAKPYQSWQRGANENTNGLIRQYFPKKTNFAEITEEQIRWVEQKLNNRPRKRFNFLTPIQMFNQINKVAFIT